jgi:hypothetical protein
MYATIPPNSITPAIFQAKFEHESFSGSVKVGPNLPASDKNVTRLITAIAAKTYSFSHIEMFQQSKNMWHFCHCSTGDMNLFLFLGEQAYII